ncbi:alpha/beta hydrolase [Solimonas terrae]|uniref:Alpha/beta hydrolase n=1 Tax=Solimonas terrae TaxID=1396819 RepID=A0A6M2BLP0_9GAMM|nr:alpha/beta hydrolase [Solimonas terrae]NGY03260.1 alpha/beta hydrolase [Solimonas terrae]
MSSNSRHLVDPELLDLLDALPTTTFSADILGALREAPMPEYPIETAAAADNVRCTIEHASADGNAPAVGLRVYRPASVTAAMGCLLHIHGGGFVRGGAAAHQNQHRQLAAMLGCVVVSVDYRLAPETRFPGNLDDCMSALSWIVEHAASLSVDPARIGVVGESAGGGLAACLCLAARDRGKLKPAFLHMMYPMLDDRTCSASEPHPHSGDYIWNRESNHFGWSSLLGVPPGSDAVSPYAAAARAAHLRGLPPTFICTGSLDLFVDENLEFAKRLMRDGVPTELHVFAGAVHGFDYHPSARIAVAARQASLSALKAFLAGRDR